MVLDTSRTRGDEGVGKKDEKDEKDDEVAWRPQCLCPVCDVEWIGTRTPLSLLAVCTQSHTGAIADTGYDRAPDALPRLLRFARVGVAVAEALVAGSCNSAADPMYMYLVRALWEKKHSLTHGICEMHKRPPFVALFSFTFTLHSFTASHFPNMNPESQDIVKQPGKPCCQGHAHTHTPSFLPLEPLQCA